MRCKRCKRKMIMERHGKSVKYWCNHCQASCDENGKERHAYHEHKRGMFRFKKR